MYFWEILKWENIILPYLYASFLNILVPTKNWTINELCSSKLCIQLLKVTTENRNNKNKKIKQIKTKKTKTNTGNGTLQLPKKKRQKTQNPQTKPNTNKDGILDWKAILLQKY